MAVGRNGCHRGPHLCQEEGPTQAACVATRSGMHSSLTGAVKTPLTVFGAVALGPSLLQTLTDGQGERHFWAV